jgi:hypothetical protein
MVMKKILIPILLVFLSGCGTWKIVPDIDKKVNPFFEASLTNKYFRDIVLKVQNKTEKNIEILWNKTLFIDESGGTNNFFTFGKETLWEEKDALPPQTTIFPGTTWERVIYPMANRYWKSAHGWRWWSLYPGKHGVFLTVLVDGKEINERLVLEMVWSK